MGQVVQSPMPLGANQQTMVIGTMIAAASGASSGRTDEEAMRRQQENRTWVEQNQRWHQQVGDADSAAYGTSVDRFMASIYNIQGGRPSTEVPCPLGFGFIRFVTAPNANLPLQSIDPIPLPLPPVTDPTPDQLHEQISQQDKANQQMATAQVAATPASTGTFGSAFKALSMAGRKVSELASDASRSVENTIRDQEKQKDRQRFANCFPQFAASEALVTDYHCLTLAGDGTSRMGHVFVSNRGIHFSTKPDAGEQPRPLYQYSIALSDVVTIVRGECGGEEWIHVVCVDCTFRSIFHIDTGMAGKVGSYVSSSLQGSPTARFYNWLDHAWRAACRVPNPQFSYGAPLRR
jgi:hypothetical protein